MNDSFYRKKIHDAWEKYLTAHPGNFGDYPHWLKERLILSMKRVDLLRHELKGAEAGKVVEGVER
jgi:hypothetical protein